MKVGGGEKRSRHQERGRRETCDQRAAALIGVFVAWLMCALKCISRFFASEGTLPPEDLLTEGILPQIVSRVAFLTDPIACFFFFLSPSPPTRLPVSLSLWLSLHSVNFADAQQCLPPPSPPPYSPHIRCCVRRGQAAARGPFVAC